MPWQIRAIAGPLQGAVYVLRRRAMFGRAGDCDIQIINDGVSRRHAKVVVEAEGPVLVDLRSNNGTFVGDQRVERRTLAPGDEFRIMGARFCLETANESSEQSHDSEVWAVKVTSGVTLRQTVDHLAVPRHEPPPRGDTLEDMETQPTRPTMKAKPLMRIGRKREPERHRMTALKPDGDPYAGDLVGDLLIFRDLQLRMIRRETLSPVEHRALAHLTTVFTQVADDPSPHASLRRFQRFACRFPARVRWLEGAIEHVAPVSVLDIGVGGARVAWRSHSLEVGVVAWLVIDRFLGGHTRTVVLPTRIAWTTEIDLGMQFAGTQEWEENSG